MDNRIRDAPETILEYWIIQMGGRIVPAQEVHGRLFCLAIAQMAVK